MNFVRTRSFCFGKGDAISDITMHGKGNMKRWQCEAYDIFTNVSEGLGTQNEFAPWCLS